jgi:hypothetical protein
MTNNKWFRLRHMAMALGLTAMVGWTPALAQQDTAPADSQADKKPDTPAADLPPAKDLIAGAIKAMGGKKAFNDIKSSHMKGTMTTPMGNMGLEMYSAKPEKFLFIQSMPAMGMQVKAGSNGKVGWVMGPQPGETQILEGPDLTEMREQTQMYEMVLRMETDFKESQTVAKEMFGDTECYKVRMMDESGEESMAFFEVKTGLPVGIRTTAQQQGQPIEVTVVFGGWKQFGDIKGFTTMTVDQLGMQMVMTFEEVDFNDVDSTIFALPQEVKDKLAAQPAATTAPEG